MEKKIIKIILIITLFLLILGTNSVWANYFEIDVNYNGKKLEMTSENPDMLYNIENFSPGDQETTYFIIKNTGKESVQMYITGVEMAEGEDILDVLNMKIYKEENVIFQGKYSEIKGLELETIEPNKIDTYKIETIFSKSAGNKYQNKEYKIKFNFEARANEIIEEPKNEVEKDEKDTTVANTILPKTGERSYLWACILIALFLIIIINHYVYKKYGKNMNKILLNILLILAVVLLLIVVCSVIKGKVTGEEVYIMGYKPYIVKTGSMEPAIETNALIIVKKDNFSKVKVGEIINYKIENANLSICHRVVQKNEDGTLITKGDNNKTEDSFKISEKEYVGTVIYRMNFVGKVISNIQINFQYYATIALIIVIAVLALIVVLKKKGGIKS